MAQNIIQELYDLGTPPDRIALLLEIPEYKVIDHLDYVARDAEDAEDQYYRDEAPKVRESHKEWLAELTEVPLSQRNEFRRRHIVNEIREVKSQHPLDTKRIKRLMTEAKILLGKQEGFDTQKIVLARQFPMNGLLKITHGMAICPFHNDKTPSMNTKNNFYFCHGCGATGDVIDLCMKLKGLTFTQAINYLT